MIDFFNKTDIDFFASIIEENYDKSNSTHTQWAATLDSRIKDKVRYWLAQVLHKLEDYSGRFHGSWLKQHGPGILIFRNYSWATIYKKEDADKYIYFTIEASGEEESLKFKLDYHFAGDKLSPLRKSICKKMLKDVPIVNIYSDELINYTWERLVNETVTYINKYFDLYERVISAAWTDNEKRVCRITWNQDFGWIRPSGPYGKSKDVESHEFINGFGHEEWLFDTGKLIEGYHYGFLQPINAHPKTYEGRIFDIWLYTIDGVSGKRYWIGEIKNLIVINNDEAVNITDSYRTRGWLNEMLQQLDSVKADFE